MDLATRHKRDTQADHRTETIGTKLGGMPSDRSTPIMAGYDRCFLVHGIKYANHISHELKKSVLVNGFWPVRLSIAPHIRSHGAEARGG